MGKKRRKRRYSGALLRDLSAATGIHVNSIRKRLDAGMTPEQVVAAPHRLRDLSATICLNGAPITKSGLAKMANRSVASVTDLLNKGLSPEQILVTPKWKWRKTINQVLAGKPCTIAEVAMAAGLCCDTVVKLRKKGMSSDEIVAKAKRGLVGRPRKPRLISVFGVDMTIREIAEAFDLADSAVRVRLKGGLSPDRPDFHLVKRGGDKRDTHYRREVSPGVYECGCRWDRRPGRSEVLVECPLHAAGGSFPSAKEA